MTTPFNLKTQIETKVSEMMALAQSMRDPTKVSKSLDEDIQALATEENKANRTYEEEIHRREALGGRTRRQTLQEFVILFFFVSYSLLVLSFGLQAGIVEGRSASIKIIGLGALAIFFIAAFILRYA
jgi:hypothetical protein